MLYLEVDAEGRNSRMHIDKPRNTQVSSQQVNNTSETPHHELDVSIGCFHPSSPEFPVPLFITVSRPNREDKNLGHIRRISDQTRLEQRAERRSTPALPVRAIITFLSGPSESQVSA